MKPADGFICPSCRAAERHRFAYYALNQVLPNYAAHTLHFAPERCIAPWLRAISKSYLSVDLDSPSAMQHMDITNLSLASQSFSLVWCSHVLEHIEEDRKAMSEIFRVLAPGGVAVIMVPIYGSTTYENPAITSAADRLRHFKQEDHVRLYGVDIIGRLNNVGFDVNLLELSSVPEHRVKRHVLDYPSTREIFVCGKPK